VHLAAGLLWMLRLPVYRLLRVLRRLGRAVLLVLRLLVLHLAGWLRTMIIARSLRPIFCLAMLLRVRFRVSLVPPALLFRMISTFVPSLL
jgi:hypothetical protein